MPYDHEVRKAWVRARDNVLRQDWDFTARSAFSLDPVETVIGCQLQSRRARTTCVDPRLRGSLNA